MLSNRWSKVDCGVAWHSGNNLYGAVCHAADRWALAPFGASCGSIEVDRDEVAAMIRRTIIASPAGPGSYQGHQGL